MREARDAVRNRALASGHSWRIWDRQRGFAQVRNALTGPAQFQPPSPVLRRRAIGTRALRVLHPCFRAGPSGRGPWDATINSEAEPWGPPTERETEREVGSDFCLIRSES